jgi:hypothetical protein
MSALIAQLLGLFVGIIAVLRAWELFSAFADS